MYPLEQPLSVDKLYQKKLQILVNSAVGSGIYIRLYLHIFFVCSLIERYVLMVNIYNLSATKKKKCDHQRNTSTTKTNINKKFICCLNIFLERNFHSGVFMKILYVRQTLLLIVQHLKMDHHPINALFSPCHS